MRVMIFIDSDNFKGVRKLLKSEGRGDRWIDFYKLNAFVTEYLEKNKQYESKCSLKHIRTYYYTGEYTQQLFKRLKEAIDESSGEEKEKLKTELQKASKNHEGQKSFFKQSSSYYFFEVRKKPLQFRKENGCQGS